MESSLETAVRIVESERSQIGHEIHDALLPLIFAASAGLDRIQNDPSATVQELRQRSEQTAAWIDEAMQVGRRLLTTIYPPDLIGGLWARSAKDTLERSLADSHATLHWNVDDDVADLPVPIAISAYRITVEAVRNAARHGKAGQIQIRASMIDGSIVLSITDDGCGFDPAQVPAGHFGLRSMQDRAALVGGTLSIESAVDGPTAITLSLARTQPDQDR